MFTYTIIIPHNNIPSLLKRLLQSIPKRTDLQVIVIDDCSTTGLKEINILKEEYDWVEWYSTVRPSGGGKARNIGLEKSKGKYIIFADADDFFTSNLNQILTEYAIREFDIAFFKGSSVDTDTYHPSNRADHLNKYIEDYLNKKDPMGLKLRYKFGEPWCKIIRRDLILNHKITFDETLIHNDTTFSYLTGFFAEKVIVSTGILYCVTTREGSVSKAVSDDRILTRINVFGNAELFFIKNKIPIQIENHYLQLLNLLYHRRFSLLKECVSILNQLGLGHIHILRKTLSSVISAISSRSKSR